MACIFRIWDLNEKEMHTIKLDCSFVNNLDKEQKKQFFNELIELVQKYDICAREKYNNFTCHCDIQCL